MTSKTNWDSKEWLQKELDLIVICNALTDHLYNVPESFLEKNGITKSATGLLDIAGQKSLDQKLGELGAIKSLELGGSGMNTARAAAKVGAKAAFMGLVGQDADGFEVRERLERAGVTSCLYDSAREATGRCTVLVTPDGERTLQTYLGASSEYTTLHTPMREIERAKVFYFTGYQLMTANQSQTIDQCVALANAGEALTAMDVSDPFVVQVCREKILTLLRQNVQIFFANELETKGLFGSLEAGMEFCKQWNSMGVFKLGSKGSLVANHLDGWPEGTQSIEIEPVNAADTTGAGDTFAAGYLSALTQGKDLKTCLNIGSALSADVVTRMGVILGDDVYKGVKEKLA